jgi:hypothetical protein
MSEDFIRVNVSEAVVFVIVSERQILFQKRQETSRDCHEPVPVEPELTNAKTGTNQDHGKS